MRGRISCSIATIDANTGAVRGRESVNANVNAWVSNAIWSPDGKRMVYSTMRPEAGDRVTELYLRETDSGVERKLGSFPLIPRKMSWAPDGKAIIMPQIVDNGSAVLRYWIEDGRSELLVPAKAGEHYAKAFPKLSRDGRTLYYMEGPPSMAQSKLIRYDLGVGRGVSIATVSYPYDLAPDGDHLVIPLLDTASKRMTIQVIMSDGQPVRELVRLRPDERVMSLAWAPDGKWIYFGRGTDAGVEIHRVAANGGVTTFTGLRTSTWPELVVHPSGNQIALTDSSGTELWRVDGLLPILARLP
jgi:Tol biopolymer transport system component